MKLSPNQFILSVVISILFLSCQFLEDFEKGNGNIISRDHKLNHFSRIRIGGNFDVFLSKSDETSLRIITDENLHEFIELDVQGNTLSITQYRKLISKNKIRIIINYTDLEELRLTGAAMIQNEGFIEEKELNLRMDGAGMIDVKIRTEFLKVILSGAGVMKIAGQTERQELNLSGAGGVKAFNLDSKYCKVTVSGIGGAEIYVTEELDAKIEGVGGIEYEGNPGNVRTEINGIGKIKPVEEN